MYIIPKQFGSSSEVSSQGLSSFIVSALQILSTASVICSSAYSIYLLFFRSLTINTGFIGHFIRNLH